MLLLRLLVRRGDGSGSGGSGLLLLLLGGVDGFVARCVAGARGVAVSGARWLGQRSSSGPVKGGRLLLLLLLLLLVLLVVMRGGGGAVRMRQQVVSKVEAGAAS